MPTKTTSGGGSADVEGTGSKASGVNAHAEGLSTTASGTSSHAEGESTSASATTAHAEGAFSVASASYSHAEGYSTTASGEAASAKGNSSKATRKAQFAIAAGMFAAAGDAQASWFVIRNTTTDATPAVLSSAAAGSVILTGTLISVLTIPVSRAHKFRLDVVARNTAEDVFAGWELSGLVVRHSSGNARLVGIVEGRSWGDTAAAAWDVTVTVDTTDATNNYLKMTVTGAASKTIRWVANIYTAEVG